MTTKKFLDYEGLGKFWNQINTKFDQKFTSKDELKGSTISNLIVEKFINPNYKPENNIDEAYNLGIKIKIGTNDVETDSNIFKAIIPVVSYNNELVPGLITPSMARKIESAIIEVPEVPVVTSEKSGLMTPELLEKLNKSIQNRLLNDSSVTTDEDGNTYLNLTFEYSDGSEAVEKINVSDLVDTYTKGEGISIDNNVISIDNNWINDNININIETISEEEISNIVNNS